MHLHYQASPTLAVFGQTTPIRIRSVPPRGEVLRLRRLEAIRRYIEENLADPDLAAPAAARALGMSVRSLHLALADSGESFGQLLQRRRLEMCCTLLRRADAGNSVADIAFACGFNSLSSFYRAFRRLCGACPRELRAGNLAQLALAA
jgi:AraC-like DNA-binding protein